jgi:ActR/RegA family two-component response regulator
MIQPSSLFVVDADARSLEILTFGFEREGYRVTGTSDLKRAALLSRTAGAEVAVVSLREPGPSSLDVVSELREVAKDLPIVVLGPQGSKADALRAGAADFLTLPTYLRDVIGVGKLTMLGSKAVPGQVPEGSSEVQTRLSEHYGLFYLLRAMASSERSGILSLTRGNRRAELRIHEGTVVSATVGAMQGLPALHHLLLWEEAALTLTSRVIPKRSQLHLSAQEILDECERFLRDFAHAARDLGSPRTVYVAAAEPGAELRGLQPSQVTPLLRLFDGRRVLADVIEESPFRIFDTVRMIRRLRDAGMLTVRADEPIPERRDTRTGAGPDGSGKNGMPTSMLAEWAMVPDQRGVVGDRRTTSRRLRPLEAKAAAPAPIPLTTKKGASATGEIAAAKRRPTPAAASASLLAMAPTVQVQLDASGAPIGEPLVPSDPSTFPSQRTPPPIRARGSSGRFAPLDDAPPARRSAPTPLPVRARRGSGPRPSLEEALPFPGTEPKIEPRTEPRIEPGPEPRIEARTEPKAEPQAESKAEPISATISAPMSEPMSVPAALPVRARSSSGRMLPLDDAPPPRSERTPRPRRISSDGQVLAPDEFDALESDFFAREADLYKREALETFDDLDPGAGIPGRRPSKK